MPCCCLVLCGLVGGIKKVSVVCARVCARKRKEGKVEGKERKGKENGKRKKELALCPERNSIFTRTYCGIWLETGGWGSIPRGEGAWRSMHVVFYSEEFTD